MLRHIRRSAVRRARSWAGIALATGLTVVAGATPSSAQYDPYRQSWTQAPPPAPSPYFGQNAGYASPRPQMMGSRCASQAGLCFMSGAGPVGLPCYCQTSFGSVGGQIVP